MHEVKASRSGGWEATGTFGSQYVNEGDRRRTLLDTTAVEDSNSDRSVDKSFQRQGVMSIEGRLRDLPREKLEGLLQKSFEKVKHVEKKLAELKPSLDDGGAQQNSEKSSGKVCMDKLKASCAEELKAVMQKGKDDVISAQEDHRKKLQEKTEREGILQASIARIEEVRSHFGTGHDVEQFPDVIAKLFLMLRSEDNLLGELETRLNASVRCVVECRSGSEAKARERGRQKADRESRKSDRVKRRDIKRARRDVRKAERAKEHEIGSRNAQKKENLDAAKEIAERKKVERENTEKMLAELRSRRRQCEACRAEKESSKNAARESLETVKAQFQQRRSGCHSLAEEKEAGASKNEKLKAEADSLKIQVDAQETLLKTKEDDLEALAAALRARDAMLATESQEAESVERLQCDFAQRKKSLKNEIKLRKESLEDMLRKKVQKDNGERVASNEKPSLAEAKEAAVREKTQLTEAVRQAEESLQKAREASTNEEPASTNVDDLSVDDGVLAKALHGDSDLLALKKELENVVAQANFLESEVRTAKCKNDAEVSLLQSFSTSTCPDADGDGGDLGLGSNLSEEIVEDCRAKTELARCLVSNNSIIMEEKVLETRIANFLETRKAIAERITATLEDIYLASKVLKDGQLKAVTNALRKNIDKYFETYLVLSVMARENRTSKSILSCERVSQVFYLGSSHFPQALRLCSASREAVTRVAVLCAGDSPVYPGRHARAGPNPRPNQ